MLRHQDENKFHCPQCSKVFISGNALENHLLKHKSRDGGVANCLGEENEARLNKKTVIAEGLSESERIIMEKVSERKIVGKSRVNSDIR